jgi:hypothetical protein
VVKALDGITGLPMWFEFPNIWIGSANNVHPRLNIKGVVQYNVREAKPRTVQFLPNWYADCRFKGDTTVGKDIRYSIDEILENGVVVDNVCEMASRKSYAWSYCALRETSHIARIDPPIVAYVWMPRGSRATGQGNDVKQEEA